MAVERNLSDGARRPAHELDELQRGHERGITLEGVERIPPRDRPERRGQPVPEPGERPGAVRVTNGGEEEAAEEE
ncbi:MAG TPA: hypothetical protein VFU47_14095 [Armatimonadota bacterium]|nr:hypothetical protein [Armatimonadota bacterium]